MKKINSQQDLDNLFSQFNWEDAFVRECYLLSPSYVRYPFKSIVAAQAASFMQLLISSNDSSYPAMELFLEDVDEVNFSFRVDLNPVGDFRNDRILISLCGQSCSAIQCKNLYYRILDTDSWGWQVRYGKENLFDESGFLIDDLQLNDL